MMSYGSLQIFRQTVEEVHTHLYLLQHLSLLLLGISQFLLIFLLQYPLEGTGWLAKLGYFLPLVPGASLARQMMAAEAGLDWGLLGLAFLNGLCYLGLGLLIFSRAVRTAKRRGLLFGY